jgi:hypothetical protein
MARSRVQLEILRSGPNLRAEPMHDVSDQSDDLPHGNNKESKGFNNLVSISSNSMDCREVYALILFSTIRYHTVILILPYYGIIFWLSHKFVTRTVCGQTDSSDDGDD